jgi:hypothetical protein
MFAALCSGSRYAMEQFSMTSTFINGYGAQSQNHTAILRKKIFRESAIGAGLETQATQEEEFGDPGKTRTSDKQFRKLLLYPPELRGHFRMNNLQEL